MQNYLICYQACLRCEHSLRLQDLALLKRAFWTFKHENRRTGVSGFSHDPWFPPNCVQKAWCLRGSVNVHHLPSTCLLRGFCARLPQYQFRMVLSQNLSISLIVRLFYEWFSKSDALLFDYLIKIWTTFEVMVPELQTRIVDFRQEQLFRCSNGSASSIR